MRVPGPASLLVAVVLLAGCGEDDSPSPPAEAERPATAAAPATIPEAAAAAAEAEPAEAEPAVDQLAARRRAVRRATEKVRRRAERAKAAALRQAAVALVEAEGATDVEIDGRELKGSAPCGVSASAVQRRVRQVLEGARVTLTSDCVLDPPEGTGRVVLEEDGHGAAVTRAVKLRPGRWAVEYAALGDLLQIVVERDGEVMRPVIRASGEKLSGSREYRVEGDVRLQVAGDGRWLVRIRQISR